MSWIDAFIVLTLIVMWCWNLPEESPLKRAISPLNNFILYTGMWHDWMMFSPDPLNVNRRLSAMVTVKAGTGPKPSEKPQSLDGKSQERHGSENGSLVLEWSVQDAAGMAIWRKFVASREVKLVDNLLGGQLAYLPLSIAEFVARQHQAEGYDVLKVELVETYRYVSPPEKWNEVGELRRNVFWTYVPPRPAPTTPPPTVYVVNTAQPSVSRAESKTRP